MPQKSTYN